MRIVPVDRGECWAEVRAYHRRIRYHRSGSGRPVLFLHSRLYEGSGAAALSAALERRFRVLTPEPPPNDVDPGEWLTAFLDGLGTPEMAVVAAEAFCLPALVLALRDPERIARLVLLPDGAAEWWGADGALEPAGRVGRVALLVPRRETGSDHSVSLIGDFLDAGETRSGA